MAELEYWLRFSVAGLSLRARALLLDRFGSAEDIYKAPESALKRVDGLTGKDLALLEKDDPGKVYGILDACEEQELRILCYGDSAYPVRLRNIPSPPPVLFIKGRLPAVDAEPVIAVIGTRSASPYGMKMARELAWDISRSGGVVLSGLTSGIDAAAARGALQANARVIGVLGTAHEQEHSSLARDVASLGALISEYAPGTPSQRHFFRERNRISAGLSVGVVVVEAPEKSGARLFAEEAVEQGKEIFAVPGNADAENSAGTLALIKDGAKLITCGWDVMSEFEPLFPGRIKAVDREKPPEEPTTEGKSRPAQTVKSREAVSRRQEENELRQQLSALSEEQLRILSAVEKDASHVDDIIEATGLPTGTVLAQLTLLQVRGYIRREAGMRIVLNTKKK